MQAKKPWVLVKGTDEEKLQGATVIGVCVNIAYLISVLVYPYMPRVTATLRKQLNVEPVEVVSEKPDYDSMNIRSDVFSYPKFSPKLCQFLKEGHRIGKPEPMFKRIGEAEVKLWKEKFGGPKDAAKDQPPAKSKNQLNKEKKAAAKAAAKAAETNAQPSAPAEASATTSQTTA